MKFIIQSFLVVALISLTIAAICLMVLLEHHYRLLSVHGNAELRQGSVVVLVIPKIGRVLDLLRRPRPLIVLVILPAVIIVGREVRYLWINYARPSYNARLKP